MHPYKAQSEANKESRLAKMTAGKPSAKGAPSFDSVMSAKMSGMKQRAAGGAVDGGMSKPRLDKQSRGGKNGATVNVIVGAGQKPNPVPVPVPVPAGPGPMAGPPGGMPMPPPGMAGPSPGLPPGLPMRKRGGSVKMDAGAGSGEGREQKAKMNAKAARMIAPQNRKSGGKV